MTDRIPELIGDTDDDVAVCLWFRTDNVTAAFGVLLLWQVDNRPLVQLSFTGAPPRLEIYNGNVTVRVCSRVDLMPLWLAPGRN